MKLKNILEVDKNIDFICSAIEAQKEVYEIYPDYPRSPRKSKKKADKNTKKYVVKKISECASGNKNLKAINLMLKIENKEVNILQHDEKLSINLNYSDLKQNSVDDNQKIKTLNSFMLCWENGLHCRAYLEALRRRGYKPAELVVVKQISNKKKSKPSYLRKAKEKIKILKKLLDKMISKRGSDQKEIEELLTPLRYKDFKLRGNIDFDDYCEDVKVVRTNRINDRRVVGSIKETSNEFGIFTGGGILGEEFFNSNKRFIHVHPGILPDIRGADCFFWSILLRGRPGMTCYFMNEYIDQGKILFQKEYSFTPPNLSKFSNMEIYHAVLKSIDIWLRAECLATFCKKTDGINKKSISTRPQNPTEGNQYHFMQKRLKEKVIEETFKK